MQVKFQFYKINLEFYKVIILTLIEHWSGGGSFSADQASLELAVPASSSQALRYRCVPLHLASVEAGFLLAQARLCIPGCPQIPCLASWFRVLFLTEQITEATVTPNNNTFHVFTTE